MTRWVPRWLSEVYISALRRFPTRPFSLEEAGKAGLERRLLKVALSRLARKGWLERLGRGRYRVVHPMVVMMEMTGEAWRERVAHKQYLPLLEFVLVRLLDGYSDRLRAVVLFGSVARGGARPESDVDLLVVADGMPSQYGDRIREALNILEGWERVKLMLWEYAAVSPNLDLLLLDRTDADTNYPFYLDLMNEGITVYDKDGFMASRFERLRLRLQELGSVRIQRPDGKWYWILVPNPRDALRVEI